jgi:hypothetical protein
MWIVFLFFSFGKFLYDSISLLDTFMKRQVIKSARSKDNQEIVNYLKRTDGKEEDIETILSAKYPYPIRDILIRTIATSIFFFTTLLLYNLVISDTECRIQSSIVGASYLIPAYVGAILASRRYQKIGIIDFTWYGVMGIICAIINGLNCIPEFFYNGLTSGLSDNYYSISHSETQMLLEKCIECILVIGTVLAVCMSILWGRDIWAKREIEDKLDYIDRITSAIKMVIAYFIIAAGALCWIAYPLYDKMNLIKECLKYK